MGRKCLIEGVCAREVVIKLWGSPDISVDASFMGSDPSTLHGKTTKAGNWSIKTLDAMRAFIDQVEKDIMNEHFDKGGNEAEPADVPAFLGNIEEPKIT